MENDFFKASNDTYVFKNNSEFSQNIHSTPGRAAQGGMGGPRPPHNFLGQHPKFSNII